MRQNKATIKDDSMENAFRQGFDEGLAQVGAKVVYTLEIIFEGTALRNVRYSDLGLCLAEAAEHLKHGKGAAVVINAMTPSAQGPKAVDDGVVDAEIVEETTKET